MKTTPKRIAAPKAPRKKRPVRKRSRRVRDIAVSLFAVFVPRAIQLVLDCVARRWGGCRHDHQPIHQCQPTDNSPDEILRP